jgi:hypothetical protein
VNLKVDPAPTRLLTESRPPCLEESHVLDRDDDLVGEGLEQLDLVVREWPDDHPGDADDADADAVADHRDEEHAAEALFLLSGNESKLGGDIGDVHDPSLEQRTPGQMVVDGAAREPAAIRRKGLGVEVVLRTEVDVFAVEAPHDAEYAVT